MTETRLHAQQKSAPEFTPVGGGLLQRKCACGGSAELSGECEGCSNQNLSIQRSTRNPEPGIRNSVSVPPIVNEVLRSQGQPLDAKTRAFMEQRFGHDFAHVRVHADTHAAQSAQAVNALAYTVGQHTVFAAGQYAPDTSAGKQILAHELTHTIQQRSHGSGMQGKFSMSSLTEASELEAEAASDAVSRGGDFSVTSADHAKVARATPGTEETPPVAPVPAPSEPSGSTEEVPMGGDAGAPACPVKNTGTLSEVSWGETSGLYPSDQNKFQPDKWDQTKTCELLKMRGAIHAVGQRGQSVHKGKPKAGDPIEQKLKVYHLVENFPAVDSEISDTEVKWFYLSADSDKPEVHPGTTGTTRVKGYGSFYNIGGGDAKKGDVYVHFYKLKPKSP
ncbi:MAG: DUF4157 domain-containing protein [Pyrinomonadaceae bacterium]|nr:DUF4157 domain-containing protein [Pyrinomonadaceae bacterium]